VSKGRMADVVGEREGFGQIGIEPKCTGQCARGLRDLEGVGEPTAEVISWGNAGQTGENLGFARETAEGTRVQDARTVPGKGGAIEVRRLGERTMSESSLRIDSNPLRKQASRIGFRCHHSSIWLNSRYTALSLRG